MKEGKLTTKEIVSLNAILNNLAAQVKVLDGKNIRIEDEKDIGMRING